MLLKIVRYFITDVIEYKSYLENCICCDYIFINTYTHEVCNRICNRHINKWNRWESLKNILRQMQPTDFWQRCKGNSIEKG